MSISTVSDLRNEIAEHLDEDVDNQIDSFIALAEARHRRDIRARELLTREALTVDARNVALPTGFLEAVNIRLLTNPVTVLQDVTIAEMTNLRVEDTGKPYYFTIMADIEFDRTPDESYSGEMTYYKSVTPLSDTDPANVILTVSPDAYLYAALAASAPYQMADERLPVWEAMYQSAVSAINLQAAKARRVGPLVTRVHGATP